MSKKDDEITPEGEISVGPAGLAASGSAYDDLRPLVKGVVGIGSPIFEVIGQAIGIPLDYLARKLKGVRERYEANLQEIPESDRQLPAIEISASVIRSAALSSDAPELQSLFAELLTSASDIRRREHPHPAFGTIIAELEPLDARILSMFPTLGRRVGLYPLEIQRETGMWQRDKALRVTISNLCRLELIWKRLNPGFDASLFRSSMGSPDPSRGFRALSEALEKLVKREGEDFHSLYLTAFGERFVAACVAPARHDDNVSQ